MATETRVSDEVEIASKKIQVGRKNYYVDLKKNQKGMFIKFVEVVHASKASRIVIPMSVAARFLEKLLEITTFLETYEAPEVSKEEVSTEPKFASAVKTVQLFVLNRRFYFDLKESSRGRLILRISLASLSSRINISIVAEAVANVADIIAEFVNSYPCTPAEVEPRPVSNARRAPRNVQNDNQDIVLKAEPVERTERIKTERPPRRQKKPSLVVLAEPAPEVFTVDGRTYTFELVNGEDHVFVRVCEQKRQRKSTMHIPLYLCDQWMNTCGSFVRSIPVSAIEAALKSKEVDLTIPA